MEGSRGIAFAAAFALTAGVPLAFNYADAKGAEPRGQYYKRVSSAKEPLVRRGGTLEATIAFIDASKSAFGSSEA